MINELIKLADYLDSQGASDEAEQIDTMIRTLAQEEIFNKSLTISDNNGDEKATLSVSTSDKDGKNSSKSKDYNDIEEALSDFQALSNDDDIDFSEDMLADLMEKANKEESKSIKANIINTLINIADSLDAKGDLNKAQIVDLFLKQAAEKVNNPYDYSVNWKEENPKTDQSKRYDSKYHHSLQVSEPEKKQQRLKQKQYNSPSAKPYGPMTHALSTRHCPDHIGVGLKRVGEGIYQCMLDGAIYNYEVGFTDQNGHKVPGGSVATQTPNASEYAIPSRLFDSRESIMPTIN